ncbi:MAG: carbamate kinase [Actinomycetota bacterium]
MKGDVSGRAGDPGQGAPVMVIALGGNAITRAGDEPSVAAQFERTRETVAMLMPVITSGAWRIVFTHGNGPQVGNILLRSDLAAEAGELPRLPVDIAVADTQGGMGYMIQQCLSNALWESGLSSPVATVITQVIVDEEHPAFHDPSKPIGRYYRADQVDELRRHDWTMSEDPQGRGWRRVVPSPEPVEIVEQPIIRELLSEGVIVIACGGGGIPVYSNEAGALNGTDAVIDKDLASALLATQVDASLLAVLTEVDRVYLNYGAPNEQPVDEIDAASLRRLASEGHFPAGSMGPKVDAVVRFIERGGKRAIITSPDLLEAALDGRAGTQVTPAVAIEAAAS